uniref:NADH-ubiquinone oxidoreductase chain 6 n=1 Tax=Lucidina sp. FM13 TaxID=2596686 RepID=A0A5C0PX73_9COLE|nr:NADH dehydrogenase subunit 6 [Lucidina sp. FM13]
MEILLWLIMISSTMFIFMNHPMSMGLILLIQTSLMSLISSSMNQNSWFSYILFLMMVGGMLILFTYMNSIASNKMFKFNNNILIMFLLMISVSLLFTLTSSFDLLINFMNSEMILMNNKNSFLLIMSKYINKPSLFVWITMIIYLLITLIATVKITMMKHGPLQKNL